MYAYIYSPDLPTNVNSTFNPVQAPLVHRVDKPPSTPAMLPDSYWDNLIIFGDILRPNTSIDDATFDN